MTKGSLNRPFISYVLTQSMLVLIVMSASFLVVDVLRSSFGIVLDRFAVTMGLVLFAQLPVAVLYARTETRNLNAVEGWALSVVFVGVTLAFELALQNLLHTGASPIAGVSFGQFAEYQAVAVIGFFVGLLLAAGFVKALFRYAVRNNLAQDEVDPSLRLIDFVPGLGRARDRAVVARPVVDRNYSELYRREVIGANIAIFGLSLMVFGPQFMHVLKLSIPLSFVFSLVCVANRMARVERVATLSRRCLHVAIQLLPLTVVSMGLMGLGTLYENYVVIHGGSQDVLGYVNWLIAGVGFDLGVLGQCMVWLGMVFALSLAANTLMLVLFARLIRPLVVKSVAVVRGPRRKTVQARLDVETNVVAPVRLMMATELKQRISQTVRTARPAAAL